MKIPVVKALVHNHTLEELRQAEEAIAEEQTPAIEVVGEDEGEQLTHAYAAVFIRELMDQEDMDFKTALRTYTQRVRQSIS